MVKIFRFSVIVIINLIVSISCTEKESITNEELIEQQKILCDINNYQDANTDGFVWVKGNLHTHSHWSDGDDFPENIIEWYKSNYYDFLAISDHDILHQGEKWVELKETSAVRSYLNKYATTGIEHFEKDGKIHIKLKTFNEYKNIFEEKNKFLLIQAEELSTNFENIPLHINAINITKKINPQDGNSIRDVLQKNIDAVLEQSIINGYIVLPIINHPNFKNAISLDDMIGLKRARFIEVFNGSAQANNLGNEKMVSTETLWDYTNIANIKNNNPLIFGIATDDAHHYHLKGKYMSNAGRGWVMVFTKELSANAILCSMLNGNFYASTGVILDIIELKNNRLHVKVKHQEGVQYKISFIGYREGKAMTEELSSLIGTEAYFELNEDILFVRCKIISSKLNTNPTDILYETAWTQPVTYRK